MLKVDEPSCFQVARWLYKKGIQSLFIEGGAAVLSHFISNGLWDEARIFTGEQFFNDGVRAPEIHGNLISEYSYSGSMLQTYING
jgi:diaminohydroxyphosphoribosylaminopyrimidine deaminase/5-amino-6-(5-phosphoribosylamino)uracil reductase